MCQSAQSVVRAAGLLYYLVSRPPRRQLARQIMDELWPDLVPSSAANSLNQTLYFLGGKSTRIYDEDESYDYVSLRGELVWLDHAKIRISTHACSPPQATRALRGIDDGSRSGQRSHSGATSGRFAAEFEYEDWAQDWRDHLHGSSFLARLAGRSSASCEGPSARRGRCASVRTRGGPSSTRR